MQRSPRTPHAPPVRAGSRQRRISRESVFREQGMDGEIKFASADSGTADALVHQRDTMDRPTLRRPRTLRWFAIVGLALLVVLGALYGFNRYRSQAIATFFANNKPPPAQIAAVTAEKIGRASCRERV